ncbi:MAG: hypothetical protein FWG13_02470 [Leptospirales bacterium]|nr:hypothetical protein [Leptospirales bacterium]
MLTTEFDLDEYTEVIRMETKERALAEGMEKVQNYILDLIDQGLSGEEIKKKIEEMPRKNHG